MADASLPLSGSLDALCGVNGSPNLVEARNRFRRRGQSTSGFYLSLKNCVFDSEDVNRTVVFVCDAVTDFAVNQVRRSTLD